MAGENGQRSDTTTIVVPLLVANLTVTLPAAIWQPIGEIGRRTLANFFFLWIAVAICLFMAPPFEIAPAGVGRAVLRLLAIAFGVALLRAFWAGLSKRSTGSQE